jgi:D-sedoheptulose 7-phosphate isomerase
MSFFTDYFKEMHAQFDAVPQADLDALVARLAATPGRGGKVIIVGNGGSAAMAAHVAVDLTKACGIRAVTFNEADLLTCFANDYGYENWVTEALKAYADPKDLVMLISSSGKSPNIVNGANTARAMGVEVVTLSGFDKANPLRSLGDVNLWADSTSYNMVEMTHHVWLLAAVDKIVADKSTKKP